MRNRLFTEQEKEMLLRNEHVLNVRESKVTYSPAFKVQAVRANIYQNIPPTIIFTDAGFDLKIIGADVPKECLRRWRKIFEERGEQGLVHDQRGKGSTGRPSDRELTIEEKLRRAESKIKYLEKENELLKKLERLEGSVVNKPSERYRIIHNLITSDRKKLFNIRHLCELADVSRSGYYRWLSCDKKRRLRDQKDYDNYLVIKEIFLKKRRKAGWRTIKMELENKSITMNHKKIRRLMKKYNLITQTRRPNPYKRIAKATKEHSTFTNVLDRQFKQNSPFKVFGTDITYLYYGNGQRIYLSILKDFATGEIGAHYVSLSLGLELSLELINQVINLLGTEALHGALVHSDQGVHYTHPKYFNWLKSLGIIQSMSRKGNCLDNAPVESFFGHMKDELEIKDCKTFIEAKAAIDAYIFEYNNHRYQWERKKMTPVNYRNHLLAA